MLMFIIKGEKKMRKKKGGLLNDSLSYHFINIFDALASGVGAADGMAVRWLLLLLLRWRHTF